MVFWKFWHWASLLILLYFPKSPCRLDSTCTAVIAIFLVNQPWILFQPRLEEFSFLGLSLGCCSICSIIFFSCICWFLSFLFLTLTRKWELCLPLQALNFFLQWHLLNFTEEKLNFHAVNLNNSCASNRTIKTENMCDKLKNKHFCNHWPWTRQLPNGCLVTRGSYNLLVGN